MRALRIVAPLAFAFAVLAPALADDAAPKRLFWRVTSDKGGEVFLLGSVHAGNDDMYPLPKEIEDAYKKADALVVEADVENVDAAKVQALVMEKGMYGEDDSLKKHLSKEGWKKLKEFCAKEGIPADQLQRMKPWLVSLQLQQLSMSKAGIDASRGIDKHFLTKAHKHDKKILELESAEFQINLLAELGKDLEEKFLLSTLDEQEKGKEQLDAIVDAWMKGDDAKMAELGAKGAKEHPEFEPVMKKLIDDRNVEMAKKIEDWLVTKGSSKFVVVGSLHLVGDKGVVKLLENKKFTVERPTLTAPAKKKDAEKKEPAGSGAK